MDSLLVGCCSLAVVVEFSPFAAKKWAGLHPTETVRLMHSIGMENAGFSPRSRIEGCSLLPFS